MGRFIIKAAPDIEQYMEWSSIVDAPTIFFPTKKSMEDYVRRESRSGYDADSRLERIEKNGTSSFAVSGYPADGAWNDNFLIVQNLGAWNGPGFKKLRRVNFAEYIHRYLLVDDPTEPFLDDIMEELEDLDYNE